jgi:ABC-type transport system involved in multi-copper enzyme maturation permease subunit
VASPRIRRLLQSELRRLLDRRALLVALGVTGLGVSMMSTPGPTIPPIHGVWDSADFSLALGAIGAAVVLAGSLAEDRRTGYTRLVLARGYSRRTYALAKALAVAVNAGLVTGLGLIAFLALAWLRLPLDAWMMLSARDFLYPFVLLSLTASALAPTGTLCGTLSRNVYVASAGPLIVLVAAGFLMRHSPFSPVVQLDAWRDLVRPWPFVPAVHFAVLYWLGFGTLTAVACGEVFARIEEV